MKITDNTQCDIWYQALLNRAEEFTGVFFVGVKTTGVFCISVCRARKPKRENVEFYTDFKSALDAGFRPCKVCRPTENASTAPDFIEHAIKLLRVQPKERVSDTELRQNGISPERVRRWFLQNHGITFQAFQRMQRVNVALQELKTGRSTTEVAFDNGYGSLSGFGYTCKKLTGSSPGTRKEIILIHRFTTPLGPMFVCATERGVCLLEFVDRRALETEFRDLQHLFNANIIAGENAHTRQAEKEMGNTLPACGNHSMWRLIHPAASSSDASGRDYRAFRLVIPHIIRPLRRRLANRLPCALLPQRMARIVSRLLSRAIALLARMAR
jgi:AraC family transcriptional regulator of adaptative response/methylated-DNA-[protein]-cysteine methyltransferase